MDGKPSDIAFRTQLAMPFCCKKSATKIDNPHRLSTVISAPSKCMHMAMASNAMSRIENQAGTCLAQILLSHTFDTDHFVQRSIKVIILALFLKNEPSVKATSSDSSWICTSLVKSLTLTLISPL